MPEGPQIDAAEDATALWCRQQRGEINTDDIYLQMVEELKKRGVQNYYLLSHAPGSGEVSSWTTKFVRRHGIVRIRTEAKFRSRRNGIEIEQQVMNGWAVFYNLLTRVEAQAAPDEINWTLFSFDETNLRRTAPQNVVMGREQVAELGVRAGGGVPVEYQELEATIGVCICSNRRFPTIPPLLCLHGVPLRNRNALIVALP
jgi:hypothetical protein